MAPWLSVLWLALVAAVAVVALPGEPPGDPPALLPSEAAARSNAFAVFNAVHAAMRQWGSSLHHNGMSLFLATVPAGQLFYHGGSEAQRPAGLDGTGVEWLAFEVEHAQMFGISRSGPWKGPGGPGGPKEPGGPRDPPERPPAGDPSPADGGDRTPWDAHFASRLDERRSFQADDQVRLGDDSDHGGDGDPPRRRPGFRPARGYLHTYRANRPLRLLYVDGMAAGKTRMGCLDTQDYLLLDGNDGSGGDDGMMGERRRALGLCALARQWQWADGPGGRIDGFVRAEAGFEIIYCDLQTPAGGLDVVSIAATPFANETGGSGGSDRDWDDDDLPVFSQAEYLRAVSLRYEGHPAGRIAVDWSSMVSAFFYGADDAGVNLTNPDAARPELPRLVATPPAARRGIRARLAAVVAARGPPGAGAATVDWQGIVDLVVSRHARRLAQLARDTSAPITRRAGAMLPALLYPHMRYGRDAAHGDAAYGDADTDAATLRRCAQHYLAAARAQEAAWTPEDRAIAAAVETVTHAICASLLDVHTLLANGTTTANASPAANTANATDSAVRRVVDGLMARLQWTTWRACDPCAQPDELCLVAMFPWGAAEDHFHPRCRSMDDLGFRGGYWMDGRM